MSFSPGPKDTQFELSVFGGLSTEMAAINLPEGASPDNQELEYAPGLVKSRRGFHRVFQTPFPGNRTVTYAKSFVTPTGLIQNLYLTSDGKLWKEDLLTAGSYTQIGTVPPGSYAKSVTAFGREYLAFSDGLHGTEVPLQWDGTRLDRVTIDGPGARPSVASVALPAVNIANGAAVSLVLNESDPAGVLPDGSFSRINTYTPNDIEALAPGQQITIAGYTGASSAMNGTWTILSIYPSGGFPLGSLLVLDAALPAGTVFSTAAATGSVPTAAMSRRNDQVTVHTENPHQLQVGFQAQITGIPAAAIAGGIVSITINNIDLPGIATVKTTNAHKLKPGCFVSISGVSGVTAGTSIATASRTGGILNVVTSAAHNLSPGAVVTLSGTGNAALDCTAPVVSVPNATTFTIIQPSSSTDIAPAAGGTVTLQWPLQTDAPEFFEVLEAPTADTFQVALHYCSGVWTTGTLKAAWDGTFFVSAVPDPNTFVYRQSGPDAVAAVTGQVTPHGQAAPGVHQCRVAYLTRNGAITRPSPPVQFTANGGQYIQVSNIPLGPPDITVGRILEFTGAGGAYFFYIPVPAEVNGQVVSTATQIQDNTTTSVLLDFSDNTLFAATATSITGNDLASQITLDSALGFGFYGDRLLAWGQRNRIHNLLNMGFDGGQLPTVIGFPTGWTVEDLAGTLADLDPNNSRWGQWWEIRPVANDGQPYGHAHQPAYRDAYGAPILQPNTRYRLRVWLKPGALDAGLEFKAQLSGTGFSSLAVILGTAMSTAGSFVEADFQTITPAVIPPDTELHIYATNNGASPIVLAIDDLSILYKDNPYQERVLYGSYVNNPEGFDGVTGKFGPSQDTHKVMDVAEMRATLYILTQDPGGRLHQTSDNNVTEPAGWGVHNVGNNCGLISAFGLCKSQADDSSASGGEEWFAWASSSGARIFGGSEPWKLSQEIQPDWEAIRKDAQHRAWALNDPVERIIYFGLPLGVNSAPNYIYPVDYKELDGAYGIAMAHPVHNSISGRLTATDHARKWTRWNRPMNGAALMYRQTGATIPVFFGGNGTVPGILNAGPSNCYYLQGSCVLQDDDFGAFIPYYVTYFFPNADQELVSKIGGHRKLLVYYAMAIEGLGYVTVTPYVNRLTNAWPLTGRRQLNPTPTFDFEWAGGNTDGQRIAFRIQWSPS